MLNLQEFKETERSVSVVEAAPIVGIDPSDFSTTTSNIWLYDDTAYLIEHTTGQYECLLAQFSFTGSKDEMANRLYFDFYVSECVTPSEWSTPHLCDLLNAWCEYTGLEPRSADEMLYELCEDDPEDRSAETNNQAEWLRWFIDLWNDAEIREYEQRNRWTN